MAPRCTCWQGLFVCVALVGLGWTGARAEMVELPGEWYDMDKYTDADDQRRAWWFYEDTDPSLGHDNLYWWDVGDGLAKHMTEVPGWNEPDPLNSGIWDPHPGDPLPPHEGGVGWIGDAKPQTEWNWVSPVTGNTWRPGYDGTCWMASADNLYRYVTGRPSAYHGWAYQGDWPGGVLNADGGLYTWQWGGPPDNALKDSGFDMVWANAIHGAWGVNPETGIQRALENGLPLTFGVASAATPGDFGASAHLVTCYGIDTVNHRIILACSDSEWGGSTAPSQATSARSTTSSAPTPIRMTREQSTSTSSTSSTTAAASTESTVTALWSRTSGSGPARAA